MLLGECFFLKSKNFQKNISFSENCVTFWWFFIQKKKRLMNSNGKHKTCHLMNSTLQYSFWRNFIKFWSNKWGTTNSEPPGPIIMIGQSEILSSSQIIFITLFCAGAQYCCAFHQPPQQCFFLCFKFVARVARGCDKVKPLWLFAKKSVWCRWLYYNKKKEGKSFWSCRRWKWLLLGPLCLQE